MSTMLIIAIVISLIGWLWLLTVAFQDSAIWGIGCLLLHPLVSIIFAVTHWGKAWKPFLINLVGGVAVFMSIGSMMPTLDNKELETITLAQQEIKRRLDSGEITENEAQLESLKLLQVLAKGEKYEPGFEIQGNEVDSDAGYTTGVSGNEEKKNYKPDLTSVENSKEKTISESEKKRIQNERIKQAIKNESRYKNIKKASSRKRGLKLVKIDDLSKHIGEDIKVTMKKGQIRKGVLVDIGGKTLKVERRTQSGRYSFNLELEKIKQVEVDTWIN